MKKFLSFLLCVLLLSTWIVPGLPDFTISAACLQKLGSTKESR